MKQIDNLFCARAVLRDYAGLDATAQDALGKLENYIAELIRVDVRELPEGTKHDAITLRARGGRVHYRRRRPW